MHLSNWLVVFLKWATAEAADGYNENAFLKCEKYDSVNGAAARFTSEVYRGVLNREPDLPSACGFYAEIKHLGLSGMERAAVTMSGSAEFEARYPDLTISADEILNHIYRNWLKRPYDPTGGETYLPILRGEVEGKGLNDVLLSLLNSDEFASHFKTDLASLPKAPDRNYRHCHNTPFEVGSQEAAHYTQILYKAILGRNPDRTGSCTYYNSIREKGMAGVEEALPLFFGSKEFTDVFDQSEEKSKVLLSRFYQVWLKRELNSSTGKYYDPSAESTYLPILRGQNPSRDLISVARSILNSAEFKRKNPSLEDARDEFPLPPEVPPQSDRKWPQYSQNPFRFNVGQSVDDRYGGIFVHELTNDGLMDFVITTGGKIAAYDHFGKLLWRDQVGIYKYQQGAQGGDYPGKHHPGAIAGDMDGDGKSEVAYLTESREFRVLEGSTGKLKWKHNFPGALAVGIANLRGNGDREIVLQYSNKKLAAADARTGTKLWETQDFISIEHSPFRQADLDLDGKDEMVGVNMIGENGKRVDGWDLSGRVLRFFDSVAINYVPGASTLKVANAETKMNDVTAKAIVGQPGKVDYMSHNPNNPCCEVANECAETDCDKINLGDFDITRPGLEAFCRSACGRAPWLFDSSGKLFSEWVVDHKKPGPWSDDGIEELHTIQWFGGEKFHLLVDERAKVGNGAIIDAVTGDFLKVFPTKAERTYAADISGDTREEAIFLQKKGASESEVLIYWNDQPSRGETPNLWNRPHYKRVKQNWNYYSP